ncbi:MAG: hypothetical protein KBD53_06550 [Candidatus Omnitrophica bacterium]|nr:hypothetical protein [Candidatus Omnitrophota bacterium]
MITLLEQKRPSFVYRLLCSFIVFTFIFTSVIPPNLAQAQFIPQTLLNLPVPGTMLNVTSSFQPALIKGIITHPENPLKFNFIVFPGDKELTDDAFNEEARNMIKYFLAALTVPENEMWVNLSPYEGDRIIPTGFGATEMGRDLLAQDYILKQLTASLMYPEDKLGGEFWNRVRKKALALYGTTEMPMNTFNKIWIVPEKAVIFQKGNDAYILENKLKVMLEEDYLALNANIGNKRFGADQVNKDEAEVISGVTSEVIREVLIPEIEREVNHGQHFAKLRQIANAMVLATWYKENLKETILGKVYVDQNKTVGIDVEDKTAKDKIYDQYIEAFQKGVYNYIKEYYDPTTDEIIPRKYFSGGWETNYSDPKVKEVVKSENIIPSRRAEINNLAAENLSVPKDKTAKDYEIDLLAAPKDQSIINEIDINDPVEVVFKDDGGISITSKATRGDSAMLTTADQKKLSVTINKNIEAEVIKDSQEMEAIKILIDIGEERLLSNWDEPGINDQKKKIFLEQIIKLDRNYPGGLRAYKKNGIEKLEIARKGANPLEGYTPKRPKGDDLTRIDAKFNELAELGIKNANKTIFALVAGGLGTRLDYKDDIKLKIPLDLVTEKPYIQLFIEDILALQNRSNQLNGASEKIPFVIMTSDETHALTVEDLDQNKYFGMDGLSIIDPAQQKIENRDNKMVIVDILTDEVIGELKQIVIVKQESVPAMKGYEGSLMLDPSDPYKLDVQPHNHGDIHILMKQSGLAKTFTDTGKKQTIFFQDTNGQVFNAIPAALGNTVDKGYKMNFVAVNRRPGENSGSIAEMESTVDGKLKTFNIEYNLLNPVLKATINPEGDVADPVTGFSQFPGNLNVFIIDQEAYNTKLEETGGLFGEIVNPKADTLVSRLEAPMQDIAQYIDGQYVGVTIFEPRFAFAAVKNNLERARDAAKKGLYPESMAPGEAHSYKSRRELFKNTGIDVDIEGSVVESQGVPYIEGARIVYSPDWALTPKDIQSKFKGGSITNKSVLNIEGQNIFFENTNIDGTLIVKTARGVTLNIKDLNVKNEGWEFPNLTQEEMESKDVPEYLKMRGYKRVEKGQMVIDLSNVSPGKYIVDSSGKIEPINDQAVLARDNYRDFYNSFGHKNKDIKEITKDDNSWTRNFLTEKGEMKPADVRQKNGTFGVTEVNFLKESDTLNRMIQFQKRLKEVFGEKVYLVDGDKLHFTSQGLEQQWDNKEANSKKTLAMHAGLENIDLNDEGVKYVIEKAGSISTPQFTMRVGGVNWNPVTGIFWELRPYLKDGEADPVNERRKAWELPQPRPPHVTAAYFTQEFNQADVKKLQQLISEYQNLEYFGDIIVDTLDVIAYKDYSFNSGYKTLKTVNLQRNDNTVLAAGNFVQGDKAMLSVANDKDLESLAVDINGIITEITSLNENRLESILKTLRTADINKLSHTFGFLGYKINARDFVTSMANQLKLPAADLAQAFSRSKNPRLSELGREALVLQTSGISQVPVNTINIVAEDGYDEQPFVNDINQTKQVVTSQSKQQKGKDRVGGIDLNPKLLDLQIKRDGSGVPLPYNQQPFENMNIDGFIPVIINVSPITNLPLMLGLNGNELDGVAGDGEKKTEDPQKISYMIKPDELDLSEHIN